MFRALRAAAAAVLAMCLVPGAGVAAVNGGLYAVVDTAYDGTAGSVTSYLRFTNGAAATSTFSVMIVGSETGQTYGQQFNLQIPKNASLQYPLGQLLVLAGASGGAGTAHGDTSYSVYILNPDAASGYQHVTYDLTHKYFEDASICENGSLAAATLASNNSIMVPNVHTASLAGGAFPSLIKLHNDSNATVSSKITIVDAGALEADGSTIDSGAGATVGSTTFAIPANTTVYKLFADLQSGASWSPSAGHGYANIIVSDPTGAVPTVVVGHSIHNNELGGDINMTTACAVNNPVSATAYQGTIAGTGMQSGTLAATVQPVAAHASASALSTQSSIPKALSVEKALAAEKASSVSQTSATLVLSNGTSVALTGAFDSATNAVTLSGNGYTFTGTAGGGVYSGTYTGPNNVVGGFSTLSTAQGAVTAYCGTYHETRPGNTPSTAGGVFNLQIAANGAVSGDTSPNAPSDGGPGTFTGQAHGATVNVHHAATNKVGNDDDIIATIQNGVISGSYPAGDNGGTGTFSGGACAGSSS